MATFIDDKKKVEITMYGINGIDFSDDFFNVGTLRRAFYGAEYIVDDVEYLVEQALDAAGNDCKVFIKRIISETEYSRLAYGYDEEDEYGYDDDEYYDEDGWS